jgi:nucleotide-binding universal stress UspA family protein
VFKNILVPVDGSELSSAAVRRACTFAIEAGARLTFYHAKPGYWPGYALGDVAIGDAYVDTAFLGALDKQAEDILAGAAQTASLAGVAFDTLSTDFDAPHEGIIAAAEDRGCDLIFMASHGRRGASALLLGSETQKVLTHCKIPVLVYR